jgi:hypothetical protein
MAISHINGNSNAFLRRLGRHSVDHNKSETLTEKIWNWRIQNVYYNVNIAKRDSGVLRYMNVY